MLSREQLRAIRKIQIRASHLVNDVFAGQYQSAFKGHGIEFSEVRHYLPGDDVRTIDWNVTARTGIAHVKRFVEERELTVMLVVDASASSRFGTVRQLKSELAAELAAVLAFSAITSNDKVGLIIFSDRIEKLVLPKKGTRHVLRVIREVMNHQPQGRGTDVALALEYLSRVTRRRCVVFLVSDLLAQGIKRPVAVAAKRHDLVAIVLEDRRDWVLADVGLMTLEDPETGVTCTIDTSDPALRQAYERRQDAWREERGRLLRSAGVDAVAVTTDRPYAEALIRFFRRRERRR